MSLYLGVPNGYRVLRYGVGLVQSDASNAPAAYLPSFETWDITPGGEMGDCVFRSIGLSFSYVNGYNIGITPVIDGLEQVESTFSGTGSGENGQAQVYLAVRGARFSCKVRCLAVTGEISFRNLQLSSVAIRQWP